ncbi:M14 family metallopeptidase [Paenibacillus pseudetheri]|uniref:Gamma-D-glutamyl-L-diamino acid endopeptidase 1 n=1 Tax=Paenibacillus pseudetheri TaxID=2897682 RepID=A0ABM9BG02_9BACL|nr:M14 family metallopeptidase [Paenibacillus pseudetheri]CAH1057045.1 Gamma-D-glutamyl-L-diamino acid endopeptidase 1 [Paenibacillus pseudetheri]
MRQYIASRGDTVSRIAALHGLTPEHVIQGNPWVGRQSYLYPGQVLFLPSSPRKRYAVQEGDDLERITSLFNVSLDDLEKLNPAVTSGRCCTPGKVLVIPPSIPERIVSLRGEYGPVDVENDIRSLIAQYPFIQAHPIGSSVLGKPIHVLKIGNGTRHLHVNAALHANEWLTSPCLMSFIEEYAAAYAKGLAWNGHRPEEWYNNWTLWAVPMANPDGVELVQEGVLPGHPYYADLMKWNGGRRSFRHWKANIRGVDLGDQFPAHWEEERERRGVMLPSPRDYSGPEALSEPEAAALAALAEEAPGEAAVSLHSQGGEIYWNYRGYEPPESRELATRLAAASSYRAVELSGSDAGYKDWFIQTFRKPGFTVELGIGKNPLPLADFEDMALETGLILGTILSNVK